MYLSDQDMEAAILAKELIVVPPTKVGPTSIDLHLARVEEAKVWDVEKLEEHNKTHGYPPREIHIARFEYGRMSETYLQDVPAESDFPDELVVRRDRAIVVRPRGFVLWLTKERVGTPEENPKYICFIDGKSTRARTGLVVHLTAPTIHAGWSGNVTLEITNLGPFDLVIHENDVVAQITVAQLSNPPNMSMRELGSATQGQSHVTGGN